MKIKTFFGVIALSLLIVLGFLKLADSGGRRLSDRQQNR